MSVSLLLIIGSVAATETTSNNSITTNDNVAQSTQTTTDSTVKSINKVSDTLKTNDTTKSSSSTASSTSTSKSSTKTTINDLTTTRNSKVTFKAVVTTKDGKYVKSGDVVFKVNGKTIGNARVSNGGAKLTYNIPSTWADINYKITATYAGNNKYATSTDSSVLKLKSNLATKIKVKNITSVQGQKITLKAVITTSDGKYVKTGKVAFKINGNTIGKAKVINGGAKYTYTIPNSWKTAKYTISVVYGQNEYYKGAKSTGILKLKSKVNPKITINTASAFSGQVNTIKTTITDSSGNKISGGKVVFKINGNTIGSNTLKNGVATISYKIPSSWSGKYSLTVVYGGYGKYNSLKKTSSINVIKKVDSKITIDTTTITSGQSVTFKATITDKSGNKVTGGKASFKINGKTIGTVSVSKGNAKLTYKIPSGWNGKYSITVVYGGYGKYKTAKKTNTLYIYKKGSNTVPAGYESYVKATKNCAVNNAQIKKLATQLTAGASSTYNSAVKIFNYVRDKITYSLYYNTRYGTIGTLNRKVGNCVDQTHVLIALMRTSKIPARYCHATCSFRSGLVTGHVWAEVYINGKWYKCDTTSRSNSFNNIVNWRWSSSVRRYTSLPF